MTFVKLSSIYSTILFLGVFHHVRPDLLNKIQKDPDLSEFYGHVTRNEFANYTLHTQRATIFAPTNQAFQAYNSADFDVLYHITNVALGLSNLPSSISTSSSGNPLIWITRKKALNAKDEIYVNNAMILRDRSDVMLKNDKHVNQVLHLIDDILVPIASKTSTVINPNAFDFLNKSDEMNIGIHRIRQYQQRVQNNDKNRIFQADGRYTFFIPVDEGFQKSSRPDKVDAKVIDGHVVPNHILFTKPTPRGKDYPTLAFSDMVKVTVSLTERNGKLYVESNTVSGDSTHPVGRVLAEIVKANIPVKNGVVHLILTPLMIVDNTVTQFVQEDPQGPLSKFYEVLRFAGPDLMQRMNTLQQLTLFAPSNEALSHKYIDDVMKDRVATRKILELHLVEVNLTMDSIIERNKESLYQVYSINGQDKIYFNVVENGDNRTMTVEAGGVNATVVTSDISATNGKIHIIDRVLGIPYMTIAQKLESDPMLNWAWKLGSRINFNQQLNSSMQKFTYFVPRDGAWEQAEIDYPSAMKKIMHMTQFDYHLRQVLERHLVGGVITVNDLIAKSRANGNESFQLQSVRDTLTMKIVENQRPPPSKYKVLHFEWRGEKVAIFRRDVNCTNGVIQVIDRVLMTDSDVRVAGAATVQGFGLFICLAAFLAFVY